MKSNGPTHRFSLRLPLEISQKIAVRAEGQRRTVTAEILLAIEAWLTESPSELIAAGLKRAREEGKTSSLQPR